MFKMILAGAIIFAMVYGGFRALRQLDVLEFESTLVEVKNVSLVSMVVIALIATIVILF